VSNTEATLAADEALAPFSHEGGENPYTIQQDLQEVMQRLVGIVRTEDELLESLKQIDELKDRAKQLTVEGNRQYNPGWHLALDLTNLLRISECIAKAALARQESRGGHTRDDYPGPDAVWATKNLVLTETDGKIEVNEQPLPVLPDDLQSMFEEK
jgi:succinate dehydrogenase / fumarate reductase flavoprotein subunit